MKIFWRSMSVCLIMGCVIFALAGCGAKPGPAPDQDKPLQMREDQQEGIMDPEQIGGGTSLEIEQDPTPSPVYPYRYPLTGLGTNEEVTQRPVMVMVENQAKARPQNGLDEADLVYEILAEGEITRFVAVYQSHSPKVIGPVRSIRPYYVEIGAGLDALIVHAGWSEAAMNMLSSMHLDHFDEVYGDGAYYWRSSERKPPHNLYTSIEKIRLGASNRKLRTDWKNPQLLFADSAGTAAGDPAQEVKIDYIRGYYVTYTYDEATGLYSRSMEGEAHKDKDSGVQLTAANILICRSAHQVLDKEGRRAVDVAGPGAGFLVQKGKVREVTWERKNGVIRPFIDGREIPLIPGQTWIHVIPENSEVQFNPS